MNRHLHKVAQGLIRYANCWEDADVLSAGLNIQAGDRVLSIGSAGDNSLSLLTKNPDVVHAVDVNPVQLYLIELKKAAFLNLEYEEFLEFLGFHPNEDRLDYFQKVKPHLSSEALTYWTRHSPSIKKGVIYSGKFENYFRIFRRFVLPIIHSNSRVQELLEPKPAEVQKAFFLKTWNNRRWNQLFRLFFSKTVMGKLGRDPAFLKEVNIPVSKYILSMAAQHLSSPQCQNNYFLHFILKGSFDVGLPHYARKDHFETIRENIHKLVLTKGFAEEALHGPNSFNKFNLSNIFEYMSPEYFRRSVQCINENAAPGSRFLYWNLMVPRLMTEVTDDIRPLSSESNKLKEKDLGFFYASVNLNQKK